jgi:serine phosphatase RsbU (regulator of sigma subunit)
MARRYALIIGIQDYKYVSPLTKTREDARSVADFLRATGDFQDVFVVRSDATRSDLVAALKRFQEQARGNDALVYFTGHGFGLVDELTDGVTGYLAAADTRVETTGNRVTAQQDGIPLASLGALLEQGNFSSLVMLLDACHSGLLLERGEIEQGLAVFSRKRDYFLITACRGFEQAAAIDDQPHSLFTGAVLRGLARENADDQGKVSANRLFDYVAGTLQNSGQEPLHLGGGSRITMVQYGVDAPVVRAVSEENPYQGLAAFTKKTRQFFFGRDREIEMLVQKVQQCGFVPLIGASGSGKSSIVRAGLIPRLEDLGWWILDVIKPGTDPMMTLRSLTAVIPSGDRPMLLVVDQFEEVFTLCRDRVEQSKFIQALRDLGRVTVVVTMRADFVEACLANEGLTQAIRSDAVWLGPVTGTDLEAAIEQPAIVQGATIQPKLLAQILQDVETEENCLPLLEFALSQLWAGKAESELTLAAYRKLGGVTGALNAHAEAIYKQLAAQKREHWVQRVMLRLVRTGEGTKDTRQRQRKSDLLDIGKDVGEKDDIESVIQTLVDGRLLVSDRVENQDVIDLSHEALMQSWKRLAGWRGNGREVRRIVDKVEDAWRQWNDNRKNAEFLMMGGFLLSVKNQWSLLKSEINQEIVEFFNQSLAVRQKQIDELNRGKRFERQLEIGSEILIQLLPRQYPVIDRLELAALSKMAHYVGGDYYDFIPSRRTNANGDPSECWSLTIGDVMGKGVPAGLIMTMTRGMLRAEVLNGHSPAKVLSHLNQVMYDDLENSNRFVTLFYSEYDPITQILSYSNAAHNPPLLWQAATDTIQRLDTVGMLIGLDVNTSFQEAQVQLQSGDVVIYYTDGFTEVTNAKGQQFDEENLADELQRACHRYRDPQQILQHLFDRVEEFSGLSKPNDDTTLVVARVTIPGEIKGEN